MLLVPDQSKPFVLNCDACKYAIGATLQQDHGNGLQPVAYFSRQDVATPSATTTCASRSSWRSCDACLHWRHYLHGTQPFTLLTDHDSLKYHKTMPNLSGRLARWIEKMAEFDYMLQHIPGKDNVVADALSRRVDHAAAASSASVNALRSIDDSAQRATCDGAGSAHARAPEPPEQRQRNIDAATKVLPPSARRAAAEQAGHDRDAVAALHGEHEARRAVRAAHGSGASVLEPPAARHGRARAAVVGAGCGRGLFAAWHGGLPQGHRIPYTGDEIALRDDERRRSVCAARRSAAPASMQHDATVAWAAG